MKTVMKATMIGLMVIALGFLLTPSVQSGSGCGSSSSSSSSSGCQSGPEVVTNEVQDTPEVNQDQARLEELSNRLSSNIANLEYRLSELIDGIEDDGLRRELEDAGRIVATLRNDISNYQFLSRRMLASIGRTNASGAEYSRSATDAHERHSY